MRCLVVNWSEDGEQGSKKLKGYYLPEDNMLIIPLIVERRVNVIWKVAIDLNGDEEVIEIPDDVFNIAYGLAKTRKNFSLDKNPKKRLERAAKIQTAQEMLNNSWEVLKFS